MNVHAYECDYSHLLLFCPRFSRYHCHSLSSLFPYFIFFLHLSPLSLPLTFRIHFSAANRTNLPSLERGEHIERGEQMKQTQASNKLEKNTTRAHEPRNEEKNHRTKVG